MALFDVPVHTGYKVLTHTSTRRFAKNGYGQVGNELLPKNPINPQSVKASAIYNKNVSGISEAGYGRAYPNYGLSAGETSRRGDPGGWGLVSGLRYSGAGSPRGSVLKAYTGAGSPRTSLMAYTGAGSPRTSLMAYSGAGSPRGSVLRDAYINDNPPPGTFHALSGLSRSGIPGRRTPATYLRGLSDTWLDSIDTGLDYNMVLPQDSGGGPVTPNVTDAPASGFWDSLTSIFTPIAQGAVQTAGQSGFQAMESKIKNWINPPKTVTVVGGVPVTHTTGTTILGLSATTVLLLGGVGVYLYTRKK